MEDLTRLKLLILLKKNGNITELIKDGFTYGQIANMINKLVIEEYIKDIDEKLSLTDFGEKWMENFKISNKLKGFDSWILPEEKSKIKKFNEKDVYLPHRNELHF